MRSGGAVRLGAILALCAGAATARAQTVISTTTTYSNQNVPLTGTLDINGVGTPTLFLQNSSTATSGITSLTIGNLQTGALDISGGSILTNSGFTYIGNGASAVGAAFVTGPGSTWTAGDRVYVGYDGQGSLTVSGGGTANTFSGQIGFFNGSTGNATISGTNSRWTLTSFLEVGSFGQGTLNITGGALVTSTQGQLGAGSTGNGTVTIGGAGSTWDVSDGDFFVGTSGQGNLTLTAGGALSTYHGYLGLNANSTGTTTISGANSRWTLVDFSTGGRRSRLGVATTEAARLSNRFPVTWPLRRRTIGAAIIPLFGGVRGGVSGF